jgi:hypothetical protein
MLKNGSAPVRAGRPHDSRRDGGATFDPQSVQDAADLGRQITLHQFLLRRSVILKTFYSAERHRLWPPLQLIMRVAISSGF